MSKKRGRFLLGAGIGLGLGLLFAPKKGEETRRDLTKKLNELLQKLEEVDYEELKETFMIKIDEIKESLKDLDQEKVLAVAKEKARLIEKNVIKLKEDATKAAKPKLEELAEGVRKETIKTLKFTIDKLEKSEDKSW